MEKNEIYLLSLSPFPSLFFFFFFVFFSLSSEGKEFEILSHICAHTHTTYCSLAYILAIDSTSSYEISELESQTSREDDGNDSGKKRREKERPVGWTTRVTFISLNWRRDWWMIKGLCRVRETKERWLHLHFFLSPCVYIEKKLHTLHRIILHGRLKVTRAE